MIQTFPEGTLGEGESVIETMIREVQEEIGMTIGKSDAKMICSGSEYSVHGSHYALFIFKLSWEHSSYEWLSRRAFLDKAKSANDTYIHMVYNTIARTGP